ncbi:AI-2E family transporter [soil metagenome]
MAMVPGSQSWQRAIVTLAGAVVFTIIVCSLFLARTVFIPIALAIFLSFVLTPLVRMLERIKLNRIAAVFVVLAVAVSLFGVAGFAVFKQGRDMAQELPNYTENIKAKSDYVMHLGEGSSLGTQLRQMMDEITSNIRSRGAKADSDSPEVKVDPDQSSPKPQKEPLPGDPSKPLHVVMEPSGNAWLAHVTDYLNPVLETLGQGAFAVVLIIFMLCKREDLRNRFLWLVGHGHLTTTTRAVDDVVQRLSRYLFAQFAINVTYGLITSFGLWTIGVNHAFLWGALGGALRYVPYLGAPIAALFPIALSMVQFPGWWPPLAVIGLIATVELITANAIEPIFFGHSMGVSEVTLLISAAIWTYLWGPIGLVLAMPITVCLVVIGEYVPGLEFVAVLLGDKPALGPQTTMYQRLTARDQDEATRIAEVYVKEKTCGVFYDELLVPVLKQARQDAGRGVLSDSDLDFMMQATREISEAVDNTPCTPEKKTPEAKAEVGEPVRVLGLSARDDFDRIVLEMLDRVLHADKWDLELAPSNLLASEAIPFVETHNPGIVCISCLRPGGLAHTRYLCKRLRTQFPDKHIVVGCWGLGADEKQDLEALLTAGADKVFSSIAEVRDHLQTWRPLLAKKDPAEPRGKGKSLQSV